MTNILITFSVCCVLVVLGITFVVDPPPPPKVIAWMIILLLVAWSTAMYALMTERGKRNG